jgi:hypothetical protein
MAFVMQNATTAANGRETLAPPCIMQYVGSGSARES